ncbi:hypothetical protein GOBAR_AA21835 [Gossypium barbadense]|uniref:Uncharacterized protein n=1 Tax=Gossypium barbadense TaxID=3634 RepID=A0A2P5X667_GOSBA|nr:hypothetical protein GOBAR_AA21835 [Gossypium barbadense]
MEIAKKGKWRLRVGNEAINKFWRSQKNRNQVKELEMLHRGMDWLWVVVEGEENSDYAQIKRANRRVVLVSQLLCWTGQFLGHGMFEKRAPALLDNLVQAFLMAPFFVLLEVLRSLFGYEPYPGFHMLVNAKIKAEIKEWQDKKQKKVS